MTDTEDTAQNGKSETNEEWREYTWRGDTWWLGDDCPECGHVLHNNGSIQICPDCKWWTLDGDTDD